MITTALADPDPEPWPSRRHNERLIAGSASLLRRRTEELVNRVALLPEISDKSQLRGNMRSLMDSASTLVDIARLIRGDLGTAIRSYDHAAAQVEGTDPQQPDMDRCEDCDQLIGHRSWCYRVDAMTHDPMSLLDDDAEPGRPCGEFDPDPSRLGNCVTCGVARPLHP